MRALFLFTILVSLAGCGTLREMNSNMQRSNSLMAENIVVMESSREAIEENTQQITRSTDTMQDFEKVIDSNTATIDKMIGLAESHSYFLPMAFLAVLVLLFLPSVILMVFYFKIIKHLKALRK